MNQFLADGWSTKSVSRVVRAARTKQEHNGKGRAENASCSYIQDEMATRDIFPATVHELEEDKNPTEKIEPDNDQDEETKQALSDSPQILIKKLQESMRIWSIHQTARWYAYYA